MDPLVLGLHHITALASDPQKNLDFYAGLLGLRLVKRTINFDSPDTYHLYYGNNEGTPGTILTFFPFKNMPQGRKGQGQLTVTSFSIPENGLDYWMKRLEKYNINYKKPETRFEETFIYFEDWDGLGIELVANNKDEREGFTYGHIPQKFAIKGFYGITLAEECFERTADLLIDQMNYQLMAEYGNRFRYSCKNIQGNYVDILCAPDALRGLAGYGTVHHVAFATRDENTQVEARQNLWKKGLNVTPVLDRQYFHSIYFREPGGVLFEIATMPPGFTVDEAIEHLGESLKLPPWYETVRSEIEKRLSPIQLHLERYPD